MIYEPLSDHDMCGKHSAILPKDPPPSLPPERE